MRPRSLLVAGATGMLTLGIALPATALPGDTTATFTIDAGALSITPPATAALGSRANTLGAASFTGSLGPVAVLDLRGLAAGGWVASVISTAFGGPAAIAATEIGYTPGTVSAVGAGTHVGTVSPNLTGVVVAVTAAGITGANSASWNPTISVNVPALAPIGTYTATITHSVA
jgi:hypothetical protein